MLEDFRLRVFVTVARLGSFTQAARELHVSQPAVSQNIAELEKAAGTLLFNRQRGSVTLTPAGEVFNMFAIRILKNYSDLNIVFTDLEKYASLSEQIRDLKSDPLFPLFQDIL